MSRADGPQAKKLTEPLRLREVATPKASRPALPLAPLCVTPAPRTWDRPRHQETYHHRPSTPHRRRKERTKGRLPFEVEDEERTFEASLEKQTHNLHRRPFNPQMRRKVPEADAQSMRRNVGVVGVAPLSPNRRPFPPPLPAPRPAPPAVPKVLDAHASSSPGGVGAELLHPGTCEPVFFAEAGGKEGFSCGPVPAVRLSAGPMQTRPLPPPSGKWQTRAEPPWTLHGHFFLTSDRRWKRAITWGLRGAAGQRPSADVPGSLSMQPLLRKGGLG